MLKLLLKQYNSLSSWLKVPKQQAKLQPKQQYKQQPKQQTKQQVVHKLIKATVQNRLAYTATTQLVKVEMSAQFYSIKKNFSTQWYLRSSNLQHF